MPDVDNEYVFFDDPVLRAVRFLEQYYGRSVKSQEPDGPDYDEGELLIVVQDAGGLGIQDTAFQDSRLTFDVRHSDQARARMVSQSIAGLLRNWPYIERDVYQSDFSDRPVFNPQADRLQPAYTWTYGFRFRGRPTTPPERVDQ